MRKNGKSGGICMFFHDSLIYKLRPDLSVNNERIEPIYVQGDLNLSHLDSHTYPKINKYLNLLFYQQEYLKLTQQESFRDVSDHFLVFLVNESSQMTREKMRLLSLSAI